VNAADKAKAITWTITIKKAQKLTPFALKETPGPPEKPRERRIVLSSACRSRAAFILKTDFNFIFTFLIFSVHGYTDKVISTAEDHNRLLKKGRIAICAMRHKICLEPRRILKWRAWYILNMTERSGKAE
jgi:hypothetical protein